MSPGLSGASARVPHAGRIQGFPSSRVPFAGGRGGVPILKVEYAEACKGNYRLASTGL